MTTDIREAAARAAREWAHGTHAAGRMIPDSINSFIAGYIAGHEAAKAEELVAYATTRLKRHAPAPSGADGGEGEGK